MMKYDVVAVEDFGDKLSVKYVDTYQNSLLKNDEKYVKVSNVAADVIREALSDNNRVYIPKNISGELSHTDVIVAETDGLEKDKMMFLANVYNRLDYAQFNVGAIDFYDYLNAFSVLASHGFFVTDENREDVYVQIIETGNESLIECLERYLEKKDRLDSLSYVYGKTKEYERKVIDCETPVDLDRLKEDFENA